MVKAASLEDATFSGGTAPFSFVLCSSQAYYSPVIALEPLSFFFCLKSVELEVLAVVKAASLEDATFSGGTVPINLVKNNSEPFCRKGVFDLL